jgi:peroxiredoxin
MRPARRRIVVAALLASFVGTCSAANLVVGQKAPGFSLPLRSGGQISLDRLRGQVVLLNFWASWCGPCREEFPALDQLYKDTHASGLVLLGIDEDAYPEDASVFLKDHAVTFPIVSDRDGAGSSRYGVDGMPSLVLIDRRGVVRWTHQGFKLESVGEVRSQVLKLLQET